MNSAMQGRVLRRGPILIALITGSVISLLNETLINVALSVFMRDFSIPATSAQWLSTGYMLVTGILVPVTAFLLEWVSTRTLFLGALAVFSAGTLVAALATSFPMLILGRFIQAVGTGPMVPLMINTTLQITSKEKHGGAIGLCMLVTLTAPAIAPALAGIILQVASWRWLFIFVLPFAVLSAVIAVIYLKIPRELSRPRLDLPSVVLSTLGFGAFIYGVSEAGSSGILASLPFILIGVAALVLFVFREFSIPNPMLDLAPFRSIQFTLGAVVVFVMMMGAFANMILLPIYFQNALGVAPFLAGLCMLPAGLLNGFCAPLAGRLYDRGALRIIAPLGVGVNALGFLVLALNAPTTGSLAVVVVIYTVMMMFSPFAMLAGQTNSLSGLSPELYSHGTAILNTLQMIAASLGSSLFIGLMASRQGALLAAGTEASGALKGGVSLAFLFGSVLMTATMVAAFSLRKKVVL